MYLDFEVGYHKCFEKRYKDKIKCYVNYGEKEAVGNGESSGNVTGDAEEPTQAGQEVPAS